MSNPVDIHCSAAVFRLLLSPTDTDTQYRKRAELAMQRHYQQLALTLALLLAAATHAFLPPCPQQQQQQRAASSSALAATQQRQQQEGWEQQQQQQRRRSGLSSNGVGFWLQRAWALAAPVGVMVALPLAGAPMRAGAAFDVEGISKALQEDTSKKYSDDGLGLVETLKKRSVQNKAKHDRELMEKTFLNSEAGIYGPFDKFVPVLKKNGEYVLLAEDEYNRLKGEGKIVGRDFVVDYQGDSAPEAVTEEAPAAGEEPAKSMLDDDADLLDGVEDAELL